jgi:hypothetical protein
MLDLEERINRVFNPDVRPLVQEAYRCYASGAARGAIVLAWTAVCADLITKAHMLKEDGEAAAAQLVSPDHPEYDKYAPLALTPVEHAQRDADIADANEALLTDLRNRYADKHSRRSA